MCWKITFHKYKCLANWCVSREVAAQQNCEHIWHDVVCMVSKSNNKYHARVCEFLFFIYFSLLSCALPMPLYVYNHSSLSLIRSLQTSHFQRLTQIRTHLTVAHIVYGNERARAIRYIYLTEWLQSNELPMRNCFISRNHTWNINIQPNLIM